jgi:HlyD family secretion protein
VKGGGMLARLADEEQVARLDRAAAAVESATAAVNSAKSAVAKALAIVDQRRQTYGRTEKLFARQTVSAETVDEARMQKLSAEAELGVALSNVEVARAALGEARAQHRFERILLDQHTLRAPFDGLVFQRRKELGAVVAPGEPVFALVDPQTVWVLAYVDEARAGEVQVGQPARIRLRSLPRQEFNGRGARIGIESDRVSEERRIYVGCGDCPPDFHLGEQAEVLITTATLADALLVPEAAVSDYDGRRGYVWTVEEGELNRRAVSLGYRTLDAHLQVEDGLPDDAAIVIGPLNRLREGRGAVVGTGAAE